MRGKGTRGNRSADNSNKVTPSTLSSVNFNLQRPKRRKTEVKFVIILSFYLIEIPIFLLFIYWNTNIFIIILLDIEQRSKYFHYLNDCQLYLLTRWFMH